MKIWITGILGFLGSHLYDKLTDLGHGVRGNDNELCATGDKLNCREDYWRSKYIDCRDRKKMYEELKYAFGCDFNNKSGFPNEYPPDVLIHCAATAHEGLSNFSPSFITQNIYEASVATFSAAIAAGVKRIVFMSSMARYGEGTYSDINTELNNLNHPLPFKEHYYPMPVDPYGIAKVAAEQTLTALCKLHNVEYVIAVPHNIIGPRQKYDDPYRNVASIMINRALQSKRILVYGDGEQKRCFSPIDDCLDSLVKMIDAPISGEIINIGPDRGEITVLELAGMVRELTGGMAEIQHVPARPNEVKNAYCSSDKARRLLGYTERKFLRECLQEMVDHIKKNGTKEFEYNFPIEIEKGCPTTWLNRTI